MAEARVGGISLGGISAVQAELVTYNTTETRDRAQGCPLRQGF